MFDRLSSILFLSNHNNNEIYKKKRYIYTGEITLSKYGVPMLLDFLFAAEEFFLETLIDYIKKDFALLYQAALGYNSLQKLHDFCTTSPETVFESDDFTAIKEDTLISLLQRDDLI